MTSFLIEAATTALVVAAVWMTVGVVVTVAYHVAVTIRESITRRDR